MTGVQTCALPIYIVSTLFLAETHYDLEVLTQELLALFDREVDKQAVSLLINWFKQMAVDERIDEKDYAALSKVYEDREEVRTMLVKALEHEKRQMYEKGLEQGEQKGKRAVARMMLARGMTIKEIAEITGLPEADILALDADGSGKADTESRKR